MESRVEIVGQTGFDPSEWLRREVLWASLAAPYSKQMEGWLSSAETTYHSNNVSRRDLYGAREDPEFQSLAFYHQGKNVATVISSAAAFKASMNRSGEGAHVNLLKLQAEVVGKALGKIPAKAPEIESEPQAYQECERLARRVMAAEGYPFGKNHLLLRASRLMLGVAQKEADLWLEASAQNQEGSLPALTIPNGGSPRSAGPRVEALQPVFHSVVESEQYRSLKI